MKQSKRQWFTPAEIAVHHTAEDCWVALSGRALNLTEWIKEQLARCRCTKTCSCGGQDRYCDENCYEKCQCIVSGYQYCDARRLAMTVLAFAGKDISSWFKGDDWVHYIHPIAGTHTPFYRWGPDAKQPVVPSTRWRPYEEPPWWLDEKYVEGYVSAKTRPLRIVNTLTGSTVTLEVCSEESIYQIMMRYCLHNSHFASYTWRYQGRSLCLNMTLAQNGIPDERDTFNQVGLPDNFYIPAILIYYNDDLTESGCSCKPGKIGYCCCGDCWCKGSKQSICTCRGCWCNYRPWPVCTCDYCRCNKPPEPKCRCGKCICTGDDYDECVCDKCTCKGKVEEICPCVYKEGKPLEICECAEEDVCVCKEEPQAACVCPVDECVCKVKELFVCSCEEAVEETVPRVSRVLSTIPENINDKKCTCKDEDKSVCSCENGDDK
ncbi:hypothetical protein JYU34_007546 [Plutella xylostella]|uniref:Cytochrome b5 domain-containing protein 1 n=1 Tax=Plutella xylostella TaxID=51655 RepID=A0ABQ7QQP2_PLUXY|nr:hypothetical protein JYU34_007546 [Plutella xylostella]